MSIPREYWNSSVLSKDEDWTDLKRQSQSIDTQSSINGAEARVKSGGEEVYVWTRRVTMSRAHAQEKVDGYRSCRSTARPALAVTGQTRRSAEDEGAAGLLASV